MDWNQSGPAAILGAIIGSVGTAIVGYILHAGERCTRRKSLCLGLATEIETLWNQHTRNVGASLEEVNENEFWNAKYPLYSDYFVNYQANAAELGEIKDPQLRADVVKLYTEMMGLLDSFRAYNDMMNTPAPPDNQVERWTGFRWTGQQQMKNELIKYTRTLRDANRSVAAQVPGVVERLRIAADFLPGV